MADDAKEAKAAKDKLLKKDLGDIAIAIKEVKPYVSVINFHLHDPSSTNPVLQDATKEHKDLANILTSIDKAPAAGGAAPGGPLSDKKLMDLVDFDNGGNKGRVPAGIKAAHITAFKDQFYGAGGGPPAAPAAGSILKSAQDELKSVKQNATKEVNRLLYQGERVTPQEWAKAFEDPIVRFESDIDARIKILEDEKLVAGLHGYTLAEQREYEIAKRAQIDSLKSLKTEFRKEVEGLPEKLMSEIKTATFEDARNPAHVAPLGEAGRRGALPDALLNGGKPSADPANPTVDTSRSLFEHAEIVRVKRLLENKVSTVAKGLVWDSDALIDVTNALSPGRYLVERAWWKLGSRKEFQVTNEGIILHANCGVSDIGIMLDAFYVKTGKEKGVLFVSPDADVSLGSLKDIAKALEERRNSPARPPTTMRLDDETVKNLMDPNGKHRFSQADVSALGKRLSNDAGWEPSASKPGKSR